MFKEGLESLGYEIDNEESRKAKSILEEEIKSFYDKKIGYGQRGLEQSYLDELKDEIDRKGKETAADERGINPDVEHIHDKIRGFMKTAAENGDWSTALSAFRTLYEIRQIERTTEKRKTVEYIRNDKIWKNPDEMAKDKTSYELTQLNSRKI